MKLNDPDHEPTSALERIGDLSGIQRIAIWTSACLLLTGLFGFLSYRPQARRLAESQTGLRALRTELASARSSAARLPGLRRELDAAGDAFRRARHAMPASGEIPSLLASISRCGREAGLEFLLFEPEAGIDREFYAEIPVSIRVRGGYHGLGVFLDRTAGLPRIVNVCDLDMAPEGDPRRPGGTLLVSCKARTYKFIDRPPARETPRGAARESRPR